MTPRELIARDADEMADIAAQIIPMLPQRGWIGLAGDLGAGKTTLVREIILALGGDESDVASPTFSLMHEYPLKNGRTVWHIDAYRLSESPREWEQIGLTEVLAAGFLTLVEWPQTGFDDYAPRAGQIEITVDPDETRRILVTIAGQSG